MGKIIPFSCPTIGEKEIQGVIECLKGGWLTTGPKVRELEDKFKKEKGVRHAIAVNSCTAALHLALTALNIPKGSEVITTINTFAATANTIIEAGYRPVFVDIDYDTMNMDIDKIVSRITPRTRAIIPVHIAGHAIDMEKIRRIADRYNLYIIQDAAHLVEGVCHGRPLEYYGDMVAYSFYATKSITTGEGGMLTLNDDRLADGVRVNLLHGMSRDAWKRYRVGGSYKYDIISPGFKYNMPDVLAALGVVQFDRMYEFLERRRYIAGLYLEGLSDLGDFIECPVELGYTRHAYHLFIIKLRLENLHIDRDTFIKFLNVRGISTSVHFIPFFHFTYYKQNFNLNPGDFPIANRVFNRIISLPLYPMLQDSDVSYIIDTIREIIKENC